MVILKSLGHHINKAHFTITNVLPPIYQYWNDELQCYWLKIKYIARKRCPE